MTEFELNLRLKQEMESLAPNRLEELLAACGEQTPVQPNIEPIRSKPRMEGICNRERRHRRRNGT